MPKILYIGHYDEQLAQMHGRVEAAEAALTRVQKEQAELEKKINEEIAQNIKSGKTTGDTLKDECILCFGFRDVLIPKVLAFNEQLKANAGKKLLLHFKWRVLGVHRMIGGGCDGDYHQVDGYVYGILSGESMHIRKNARPIFNLEFTLPFSRYVTMNIKAEENDEKVKANQPFVLVNKVGIEGPDVNAFLEHIKGNPNQDCQVLFEPKDKMHLPRLEAMLAAQTEEEKCEVEEFVPAT